MGSQHCDICVIGAGAAGLSVAAGAAQLGARVVLVEDGLMGGECLNTGCVPSKALLAAAAAGDSPEEAHQRVQEAISAIAPHDSRARFEGLGVRVIAARATFTGPREIEVGGEQIRARRFVIATGSRPLVPPIAGLDGVPVLTNETLFENPLSPAHLLIIGAGPVGVEMAQAWRRLGSAVTVLSRGLFLPRADPELAAVVRAQLDAEGVRIIEHAEITRVDKSKSGVVLDGSSGGQFLEIEGSHLLVAAGRVPVTESLNLAAAGVALGSDGITVDRRLRTTNRRIYAAGDVTGPHRFTHMAAYQAGIIIRHALFRLPAKTRYDQVPSVVFTAPELAQVGLDETQARAAHGRINVLRAAFSETDRAIADGKPAGHIKVVTTRRGRVLGVSIAGERAGELLQPWSLMLARRLPIKAMASLVAPYPTYSEINVAVARSYFFPTLMSPRVRALVRLIQRFG